MMDRKEKLEIAMAEIKKAAGQASSAYHDVSVAECVSIIQFELDALEPKRWPCAMVPDDFIAVEPYGDDLIYVWTYDDGNVQSARITKPHAVEMAYELLHLAGEDA